MKFRRLMTLVLCFMVVLNAISFHAAANGEHRFQEFRVQGLTGGVVPVEVEERMFKGSKFVTEGRMLTEWQWVDFLVRNLLVGKNADKITKVVLRGHRSKKTTYETVVACPPVFFDMIKFYAAVSRSGTVLTIKCPDVSSTFCDKWYLNETGLALFGR